MGAPGLQTARLPAFRTSAEFASFVLDPERQPQELQALQVLADQDGFEALSLALGDLLKGGGDRFAKARLQEVLGQIAEHNFPRLQAAFSRFDRSGVVTAAVARELRRRNGGALATGPVVHYAPEVEARRLVAPPPNPFYEVETKFLPRALDELGFVGKGSLEKALNALERPDQSAAIKVIALKVLSIFYHEANLGTFLRILTVIAERVEAPQENHQVKGMASDLLQKMNASPPNILEENAPTLQLFFNLDLNRWERADDDITTVHRETLLRESERIQALRERLYPRIVHRTSGADPWLHLIPELLGFRGKDLPEKLVEAKRLFTYDAKGADWQKALALAYYLFQMNLHLLDFSPFLRREEADSVLATIHVLLQREGVPFRSGAKKLYARVVSDQLRFVPQTDLRNARLTLDWAQRRLALFESIYPTPPPGWETQPYPDGKSRRVFSHRLADPQVEEMKEIRKVEEAWKEKVGWRGQLRAWWSTRNETP